MISQSKTHLEISTFCEDDIDIEKHPTQEFSYQHHPYLRMFYSKTQDNQVLLFANGETFELDAEEEFARYLCENNTIHTEQINNWIINPKIKKCFHELIRLGCIEILDKPDADN
jgi:hypothetical protein